MSQKTIQHSIVRSPKTLTIASGVITVTDDYHLVAGEGAANDDLVTINGGAQGARLLLRASSDSVTITVKHGSGNIKCHGSTDIALAEDDDFVMLVHNGTSWAASPFKVEVDPSLGKAELRTATLAFADSVLLGFGNTAATPDITVTWDATRLVVAQATANSEIRWGVDGAGIDQMWYGDTASQSLTWDQSADALVMTAAVSISGQGSTVVPVIPIAAQQALSGAGAINITSYYTAWTTTGADAGTLANGAQKGQLKKIQLIVDGGDGTLTPTSLSGGTTITFADVGDYALLCWNGTAWVAIELGNAADGATAPVLA